MAKGKVTDWLGNRPVAVISAVAIPLSLAVALVLYTLFKRADWL